MVRGPVVTVETIHLLPREGSQFVHREIRSSVDVLDQGSVLLFNRYPRDLLVQFIGACVPHGVLYMPVGSGRSSLVHVADVDGQNRLRFSVTFVLSESADQVHSLRILLLRPVALLAHHVGRLQTFDWGLDRPFVRVAD